MVILQICSRDSGGHLQIPDGSERAYLYYPVATGILPTRNVVDYISEVPDGYKIRRVTENEGTVQYTADQVLEKYTGTDSVLTVPMGVTKVKLNEKNTPFRKNICHYTGCTGNGYLLNQ